MGRICKCFVLFTTHCFTKSIKYNVRIILALLKKIMMMGKFIEKRNISHWSATVMTPLGKNVESLNKKRVKDQSKLVKTSQNWSKVVKTG